MAEKISSSKGFDDTTFDTYVPELEEAADIRNALELFFYGNSEDGNATGDVSLHATLVDFDTRIDANDAAFDGHTGAISDVHGTGAGNLVVGTGTVQTLTNKTLTTPKINENVNLTATSSELNILDGATLSTAELNYVDGVTSSIQTQINTVNSEIDAIDILISQNAPSGMISIYAGSSAPTGWLICDGASYASASYSTLFNVIGYTFGGSGSAFSVPNLKGRIVVGIDAAQASFDVRGEIGGAMSHQHASGTSGSTSVAHNHSIDPPLTNTYNHDGHNHNVTGHTHDTTDHSHSINPGETGTNTAGNTGNRSVSTSGNTFSTVTLSNHSHNVNIATFNSGGASAGNTTGGASANATSGNTGDHAHSLDIGVFNTTGGEGGSHTHTVSASDTISNLQPYMALNYIIKV